MSTTVIFTQTDNGTAGTYLTGKLVYGTNFYIKRMNHFILPIVDGTEKVYDAGPKKVYGNILMKDISVSNKNTFLTWLTDTIVFSKNRFDISGLSNVNWGVGINSTLQNCRFTQSDTKDVFELLAPGKYTINFPYMAVI